MRTGSDVYCNAQTIGCHTGSPRSSRAFRFAPSMVPIPQCLLSAPSLFSLLRLSLALSSFRVQTRSAVPAMEVVLAAQIVAHWTNEEARAFFESFSRNGRDWACIAGDIRTKTADQVRSLSPLAALLLALPHAIPVPLASFWPPCG